MALRSCRPSASTAARCRLGAALELIKPIVMVAVVAPSHKAARYRRKTGKRSGVKPLSTERKSTMATSPGSPQHVETALIDPCFVCRQSDEIFDVKQTRMSEGRDSPGVSIIANDQVESEHAAPASTSSAS